MNSGRLSPWLTLLASAAAGMPAPAAGHCAQNGVSAPPPAIHFRIDNDFLGGRQQDQGYSNGAMLTLVSPNLSSYSDDPCLPRLARWGNRHLQKLHASGFEQQNMTFSFGQTLFTPADRSRDDLIETDRPYAAVLLANVGYNARNGNQLRTTQLALGMVGPWAQGKQVQDAVHGLLGDEKFHGWDNQLHNEPVFKLLHERLQRWPADGNPGGWGGDAISHWGGALGNLATHANAGAELRLGWKLPDDFGSSSLRPAGENTAPVRTRRSQGWSGHLFLTGDARWVLRDITLDGNSLRSSHRVDKRRFVGEIGYGVAVTGGKWKFALGRYHRTREFEGQQETPVFGSFTISRML